MFLHLITWTEWLTRRLLTTRVTSGSHDFDTLVNGQQRHIESSTVKIEMRMLLSPVTFLIETISNGSGRAFCNEICFNLLSKVISLPTYLHPCSWLSDLRKRRWLWGSDAAAQVGPCIKYVVCECVSVSA